MQIVDVDVHEVMVRRADGAAVRVSWRDLRAAAGPRNAEDLRAAYAPLLTQARARAWDAGLCRTRWTGYLETAGDVWVGPLRPWREADARGGMAGLSGARLEHLDPDQVHYEQRVAAGQTRTLREYDEARARQFAIASNRRPTYDVGHAERRRSC